MSLSIFQFTMSNLFILFRLAAVPQKLQAERRLTCGGSPMGEKTTNVVNTGQGCRFSSLRHPVILATRPVLQKAERALLCSPQQFKLKCATREVCYARSLQGKPRLTGEFLVPALFISTFVLFCG